MNGLDDLKSHVQLLEQAKKDDEDMEHKIASRNRSELARKAQVRPAMEGSRSPWSTPISK
eukprot:11112026-Heterocapsa_arctica.AAC.1